MSHALELTLKAYLVACGGLDNDDLRDLSHDIEKAHTKAAALGLYLQHRNAISLIRILSDFHKAFVFRYPQITKDDASLIVRGTLLRATDGLVPSLDVLEFGVT